MSKYLLLLAYFISSSCFAKIKIGITVDDLPAAGSNYPGINRLEISKKYLKTYKNYNYPPQYGFLNGVYLEGMKERYEILSLWKKAGHYIGNHTYSHNGLGQLGDEKFKKDIEDNESFLIDFASSISELKWLRYPFLDEGGTEKLRYSVRSYLKKRNYRVAQVSIDSADWHFNSAYIRCLEKNDIDNSKKIIKSFVETLEKIIIHREQEAQFIWGAQKELNHVLLLHLSPLLADAASSIFKMFEKNKWEILDANLALQDKTYEEDTAYINKNGKDYIIQSLISRGFEKRTLSAPQVPSFVNSVCK